jgi:hypothetical protein
MRRANRLRMQCEWHSVGDFDRSLLLRIARIVHIGKSSVDWPGSDSVVTCLAEQQGNKDASAEGGYGLSPCAVIRFLPISSVRDLQSVCMRLDECNTR